MLLIEDGMLPDKTSISPSFKSEILLVSSCNFSAVISGETPVSSVSLSFPLTFTLILVFPSSSTNSDLMLSFFKSLTIKSPTNPATNPIAIDSTSRFFNTLETLIPFPPAL